MDPVFHRSHCFKHARFHTSNRMQWGPRSGVVCRWLFCYNPPSPLFLLHACSDVAPAEDFQGGQIVPEAAPGTVTTTGQLLQSTGALLGDMIEAHAFSTCTCTRTHMHTHTHTHAHTHTQSKKWHCQTRWHAAHSRAQEDIPLTAVWHVQVSLCDQDKPWMCWEIIRLFIPCHI